MEQVIEIAVSIIVRHSNFVLLVQRSQKEGDLNWQFPSGKLEYGESVTNAAEREAYEETGVKCRAFNELGSRKLPHNNISLNYVVCEYVSGNEYLKDRRENKAIKWVRTNDLMAYIPNNLFERIKDYFNLCSRI